MNPEGVEVWRGGVNPWECDVMGHMNVRFYVAKATQGLVRLAAAFGMPQAFTASATATLQVREHHIRFVKEARPGAALHMTGGVLDVGETEATLLLVLRHSGDGEPAAVIQARVAHVTPDLCNAFAWPRRMHEALDELRVQIPQALRPRSLTPAGQGATGSLQAALERGMPTVASGAVGPSDCDAFGRLRPEAVMGCISDGFAQWANIGRLPGPHDADGATPRLGAAAVEMRLVYSHMPQAGELIEMRSGLQAITPRTQTIIHWLLDPVSGQPWAAAEHVVVSLDLEARKMTQLPPQMVEALRAHSQPDLTV